VAFSASDATVTVSASTSVSADEPEVAFGAQDATVTTGAIAATSVDAECPEVGFDAWDVADWPTTAVYGAFRPRRRIKGKWRTF
jgi:hypothetical protein